MSSHKRDVRVRGLPPSADATSMRELLADFDLEPRETRQINGGNTNWSFRVQTQIGEVVATLCLEKTFGEVAVLTELLRHLAAHGFPTNRLILTKNGLNSGTYRGFAVLVKSWLPGEVVLAPGPPTLARIGAQLARLHALPPTAALPRAHIYGLPQVAEVLGSGVDPELEAHLRARLPELTRDRPELPSGLVHGDLFADNVVLHRDEVYIIDFEEAARHTFAFDLGMAMTGLCASSGELDLLAVRALLEGYERVRPLTRGEREALGEFAELSALACACWRLWRYNISWPLPERADLYKETVALARSIESVVVDAG